MEDAAPKEKAEDRNMSYEIDTSEGKRPIPTNDAIARLGAAINAATAGSARGPRPTPRPVSPRKRRQRAEKAGRKANR